MRIVLEDVVVDGIVAREYVDDAPEGEFVLAEGGAVVYRHAALGEIFANADTSGLADCVRAWDRYRAAVRATEGEAEQLRVVETLRAALAAHGALREGSFWSNVLEQAEEGQL